MVAETCRYSSGAADSSGEIDHRQAMQAEPMQQQLALNLFVGT
jgi:hypothetical protein